MNRCPMVVHPIQRLQEAFRERTLSEKRWITLRDSYAAGRADDSFHHEMSGAGLLLLEENQRDGGVIRAEDGSMKMAKHIGSLA